MVKKIPFVGFRGAIAPISTPWISPWMSLVNNNARSYLTTLNPVATGGFGELSLPKQSSKTPKLKYETL